MSVELEYNGNRYMVDGGKWYRRLEVGETVRHEAQSWIYSGWIAANCGGYVVERASGWLYRVPCTDPRPPFTVGQRVRVSRGPAVSQYGERIAVVHGLCDNGSVDLEFDTPGYIAAPWCLDPVEPKELLDELAQQAQETGMYDDDDVPYTRPPMKVVGRYICHKVPEGPQPNGMPCLDWVLVKLSRQPEKAERTRAILQRAMGELVRLEAE